VIQRPQRPDILNSKSGIDDRGNRPDVRRILHRIPVKFLGDRKSGLSETRFEILCQHTLATRIEMKFVCQAVGSENVVDGKSSYFAKANLQLSINMVWQVGGTDRLAVCLGSGGGNAWSGVFLNGSFSAGCFLGHDDLRKDRFWIKISEFDQGDYTAERRSRERPQSAKYVLQQWPLRTAQRRSNGDQIYELDPLAETE
jgi:hypothetical protein